MKTAASQCCCSGTAYLAGGRREDLGLRGLGHLLRGLGGALLQRAVGLRLGGVVQQRGLEVAAGPGGGAGVSI